MTLFKTLERLVGKERMADLRDFDLADLAQAVVGENDFSSLENRTVQVFTEYGLSEEQAKRGVEGVSNIVKKLGKVSVYKFLVDGVANNLFSLVYSLNEYFIVGMTVPQVAKTRAAAAVGNTLTGRPYGVYMDWAREKLGVTKKSHWLKKYFADVLIFATGQTPLYFLYMLPARKSWEDMVTGAVSLTLIAPLTGRPQNATYDLVRTQLGVNGKAEESKTEETLAQPKRTERKYAVAGVVDQI